MRISLIVFLSVLSLFVGSSDAGAVDTWVSADQTTVKWDASTGNIDGTPFEAGVVIEYRVFIDKVAKSDPIQVWQGEELQASITMPKQGRYLVGLQALKIIDGEIEAVSETVWSDDPAVVGTPGTFGVVYFKNPKHPVNLRK